MLGKVAIERISRRVPLIKRMPIVRLLLLGELAFVARKHVEQLRPAERRRLLKLLRRPHRLTAKEKRELRRLVGKLNPRGFAGSAAERIAPLPLPRRLTKARY